MSDSVEQAKAKLVHGLRCDLKRILAEWVETFEIYSFSEGHAPEAMNHLPTRLSAASQAPNQSSYEVTLSFDPSLEHNKWSVRGSFTLALLQTPHQSFAAKGDSPLQVLYGALGFLS